MSEQTSNGAATPAIQYVERGEARLACVSTPGATPTVVFLCGYASDMAGTKALHLEAACRAAGRAYLRLDYQGHGASSGLFEDGTLGQWRDDARAVVEAMTDGPLLLVGSSMGGWIALLLARDLGARVRGLVGVAAAPDFGGDIAQSLEPAHRETLERDGVLRVPSEYGPEPTVITRRFIEESRQHDLLAEVIPVHCPVRLLQGMQDDDVPWTKALAIAGRLESRDVRVTLIKSGRHRLSEPSELDLVASTVTALAAEVSDD